MKNKLLFVFTICMAMVVLFAGCNTSSIVETQGKIDNISSKWVPDKREGICDVIARIEKDNSIIVKGETSVPEAKAEIINTLSKEGSVLIDSILILPDTLGNKKYMGLVTISVANLKKAPSHNSELVSQAILGTPVQVLKSKNSWLLVQTPDKYIAWVEKSSINLMTASEMNAWRHSPRLIYLSNIGLIYSIADEKGIVGDLVAGCIVVKTGESKSYYKIVLPDGREGKVKKDEFIDFNIWKTQVICSEDNVCDIAAEYNGLPYLWGGTSSKSVDCSGYSKSVYFMNGLIIARDASLQALHGVNIDITNGFDELKRGDLLFFGSEKDSALRITHVAIYIGDGDYYNSAGRVQTASLNPDEDKYLSHRVNSLQLAKRYIDVKDDIGIVPVSKHPWY